MVEHHLVNVQENLSKSMTTNDDSITGITETMGSEMLNIDVIYLIQQWILSGE